MNGTAVSDRFAASAPSVIAIAMAVIATAAGTATRALRRQRVTPRGGATAAPLDGSVCCGVPSSDLSCMGHSDALPAYGGGVGEGTADEPMTGGTVRNPPESVYRFWQCVQNVGTIRRSVNKPSRIR
ncbi:hypothetical protein GCM10009738_73070 [Kitasatospora viridis]